MSDKPSRSRDLELGGGLTRPQQMIDHAVGFSDLTPIGRRVARGEPLARIHAPRRSDRRERNASAVLERFG